MKVKDTLWEYRLQPEDSGRKYLSILRSKFHFSQKLLHHLKQGERVWVNGRFTYLTARGKEGETLAVQIGNEEQANIPGEDLPLQILFEDEYLLAVNKPAGQVVHPTNGYVNNTLANAVIGYWQRKGEYRLFRPIHRIDRNTTGVVVIAKNQFAHQQLYWQLKKGFILKCYCGFVEGIVPGNQGTIEFPLGLAPNSFIKRQADPEGLPACTIYRVLNRYPKATLLEFIIETGRTHQIRAHCEGLGYPLLGDDLYGGNTTLMDRQALHSLKYSFSHPVTNLPIVIRAPFPHDLRELILKLKSQKL